MKRIILLIICCLASTSAMAQIYKCTQSGGSVAYQNKPCGGFGGQEREELISTDKRPTNSGTPWYHATGGNNNNQNTNIYNNNNGNNKYDRAINKMDNRRCQRYMDRLEEVNENWDNVRKQGYQDKQKRRHKQYIKNAERDVRTECN